MQAKGRALPSADAVTPTLSIGVNASEHAEAVCPLPLMNGVGHAAQGRAHRMTDEEREEAIVRAGEAMVRHRAKWEAEGCFAARGDADRSMRLMYLLIAGRSPEYVAKLERARGLA